MVDHERPVGSISDVQFDPVGAHFAGQPEGTGRVLRGCRRRAAMADDQHERSLARLVERTVYEGPLSGAEFAPSFSCVVADY